MVTAVYVLVAPEIPGAGWYSLPFMREIAVPPKVQECKLQGTLILEGEKGEKFWVLKLGQEGKELTAMVEADKGRKASRTEKGLCSLLEENPLLDGEIVSLMMSSQAFKRFRPVLRSCGIDCYDYSYKHARKVKRKKSRRTAG